MNEYPVPGKRRTYLDVLKGLGMICVVAGHISEYHRGTLPQINAMFECIYLFHMALFCIASGLVAKWNPWKVISQQTWVFCLCQLGMTWFRINVLQEEWMPSTWLEVFLPWRHMWYLYALILWSVTLPILRTARLYLPVWYRLPLFGVVFFIGLLSGRYEWPYALNRVLAFFPFFAFGVLFSDWMDRWNALAARHGLLRLLLAGILAIPYVRAFSNVVKLPEPVYEGARIFQDVSYLAGGYTAADRAAFYLIGIGTVVLLIGILSDYSPLAELGRRTMPIYILHMPLYAWMIQLGCYKLVAEQGKAAVVVWLVFLTVSALCGLSCYPLYRAFSILSNIWYKIILGCLKKLFRMAKECYGRLRNNRL